MVCELWQLEGAGVIEEEKEKIISGFGGVS